MKHKIFLFILTYTCLYTLQSQDSIRLDKVKQEVLEEVKAKESIDQHSCISLMNEGQRKINNDSIIIPQYFLCQELSTTEKKILIDDYGLYDVQYVQGDFVVIENMCYEELMLRTAKQKFGTHFLDNVRIEADSLVKNGKGYSLAHFENDSLTLKEYIQSKIEESAKYIQRDTLRAISFDVLENGKFNNIRYLEGVNNVMVTLKPIQHPKVRMELQQLMRQMPEWKPARFRGHPIREQQFILLNEIVK